MLYSEGQKVKFKYTGDVGVIEEIDGDLAQVRLLDGDLIPAPLENLSLVNAPEYVKKSPAPAVPSAPKGYDGPIPVDPIPDLGKGVFVLFNLKNSAGPFEFGILNLTEDTALVTTTLAASHHTAQIRNSNLSAHQYISLGEMPYEWLGDSASFSVEAWPKTKTGSGQKITGRVKIKVSHFFDNSIAIEELGGMPFRYYRLLQDWIGKEKKVVQDLKTYTKKNLEWKAIEEIMEKPNEVQEKAVFPNELDLHIESLTEHYQKLSSLDILKVQIRHVERYIAEAIKLGVDHVYLIHGLGTGRLREEIHHRLKLYPQISSFKNEYHPLYGWGATEVIFG